MKWSTWNKSFLVLLFASVNIFTDCHDCPPNVKLYFVYTSMKGMNIRSLGLFTDQYDTLKTGDSVIYQDWWIRLHGDFTYVAKQETKPSFHQQAFAGLYALSECAFPGQNGTKSPLKKMEVFTVNAYNTQYPAGSNITSDMGISYQPISVLSSIDSFFFPYNEGKWYAKEYVIKPRSLPGSSGLQSFVVITHWQDGRIDTARSETVLVKR